MFHLLPCTFGRYTVLRRLGEGGMGFVYEAEDTQLGRRVALKVPRFLPDDGPEVIQRFLREARVAARIHHPNICPVYEAGEIEGIHYLTMPLLDGTQLSKRPNHRQPMPVVEALRLAIKLGKAVQHMHAAGAMHRDLKPANVMWAPGQEPIIMDFGLARSVTGADLVSRTGETLGTPEYMAPEQIKGDVQAMGPACDVYSLGVVLYELLTGQRPFEGPLVAMVYQILRESPKPPSAKHPGLGSALDAICLKAMAREVSGRYASMAEFVVALEDCLRRIEEEPRAAEEEGRRAEEERRLREAIFREREEAEARLEAALAAEQASWTKRTERQSAEEDQRLREAAARERQEAQARLDAERARYETALKELAAWQAETRRVAEEERRHQEAAERKRQEAQAQLDAERASHEATRQQLATHAEEMARRPAAEEQRLGEVTLRERREAQTQLNIERAGHAAALKELTAQAEVAQRRADEERRLREAALRERQEAQAQLAGERTSHTAALKDRAGRAEELQRRFDEEARLRAAAERERQDVRTRLDAERASHEKALKEMSARAEEARRQAEEEARQRQALLQERQNAQAQYEATLKELTALATEERQLRENLAREYHDAFTRSEEERRRDEAAAAEQVRQLREELAQAGRQAAAQLEEEKTRRLAAEAGADRQARLALEQQARLAAERANRESAQGELTAQIDKERRQREDLARQLRELEQRQEQERARAEEARRRLAARCQSAEHDKRRLEEALRREQQRPAGNGRSDRSPSSEDQKLLDLLRAGPRARELRDKLLNDPYNVALRKEYLAARTPELRLADRELAKARLHWLSVILWSVATLIAAIGAYIGGRFGSGATSGNSALILALVGVLVGALLQWPMGPAPLVLAAVVGVATGVICDTPLAAGLAWAITGPLWLACYLGSALLPRLGGDWAELGPLPLRAFTRPARRARARFLGSSKDSVAPRS
jgi:hypothetical protein